MNALGNKETVEIPLPKLGEVLSPQDVFLMEMKLNEIPNMRFHVETRGYLSEIPNPEHCRHKEICGHTGKCESIRKYDRSCND